MTRHYAVIAWQVSGATELDAKPAKAPNLNPAKVLRSFTVPEVSPWGGLPVQWCPVAPHRGHAADTYTP